MRAIILFTGVALLFISLTAHAETAQTQTEYNPEGRYTPGVKYVVSLPSQLSIKKPSVFSGTFKSYTNPFSGIKYMIPDKGEYRLPGGVRFVGAFDYIPKRMKLDGIAGVDLSRSLQKAAGGSFVFAGDRFDDLADEGEDPLVSGIFVSLYERALNRYSFELVEATPDYVHKLSVDYREALAADQEYHKAVKAHVANPDAGYDSQRVSSFLNFASGALGAFGGASNIVGRAGNLGRIGAVAGNMKGKMDMADMTLQAVKGMVTEDQSVDVVLSGAVGDKMKALLKQKGGAQANKLLKTLDMLKQN
jgi:hypothetical protein